MSKHAMLSASGAERWLICTPSARLELTVEETESIYADEGTLAHQLADWVIKEKAYSIDLTHKKVDIIASEHYNESMVGYIDEYANFVVDLVRDSPPGTILLQEQRINFNEYVPEGFGTVDIGLIGPGHLRTVDLKYGKGVAVDAYENKQQMLYALGILLDYEVLFDIEEITMTIYQPRINNISSYTISRNNLIQWANEVLRPTAIKAFAGEGDFIPGEHCRFCRVRSTCKANATHNLQVAAREFDIATISDEQVVKIYLRIDAIKNWLNSIESYVKKEAIAGRKWPSLKTVQGRSVRKYTNENEIATNLEALGYTGYIKPGKLIGITEMQKKIKREDFVVAVAPYLIKPDGAPTIVHVSDGRPEWNRSAAASQDFEDINYEEVH